MSGALSEVSRRSTLRGRAQAEGGRRWRNGRGSGAASQQNLEEGSTVLQTRYPTREGARAGEEPGEARQEGGGSQWESGSTGQDNLRTGGPRDGSGPVTTWQKGGGSQWAPGSTRQDSRRTEVPPGGSWPVTALQEGGGSQWEAGSTRQDRSRTGGAADGSGGGKGGSRRRRGGRHLLDLAAEAAEGRGFAPVAACPGCTGDDTIAAICTALREPGADVTCSAVCHTNVLPGWESELYSQL